MTRRTRLTRLGALLAVVTVASHGSTTTAEAMKGIRAIVFSGEALREPVRVHDSEYATAVWLKLRAGPMLPDDSASILNGRRCVIISAFIFNEKNENVPVEELPAGHGDYTYRMYLLGPGESPLMRSRDRLWKLHAAVAQDLVALGIPVADTTGTTTGCVAK